MQSTVHLSERLADCSCTGKVRRMIKNVIRTWPSREPGPFGVWILRFWFSGQPRECVMKRNGWMAWSLIAQVKHMFDDLVDCKRILRETAIMTRQCAHASVGRLAQLSCSTRLSHPHIVQIYDIIEPDPWEAAVYVESPKSQLRPSHMRSFDELYIVMEPGPCKSWLRREIL